MYYLYGLEENVTNIISLAKNAMVDIGDNNQLKSAYMQAIGNLQPEIMYNRNQALQAYSSQLPNYVMDTDEAGCLTKAFKEYSVLTDINDLQSSIEGPNVNSLVNAKPAFMYAQERIMAADEDLFHLLNLVVNAYFYCPATNSLGGGSTSSAVGILWCSYKREWHADDVVEFFVHELTHQLVFVDEITNGHYYDMDEIAKPENFAFSSVLRRQRPLDKVIHALIVASEIVCARRALKLKSTYQAHPQDVQLLDAIPKSIESILELPNVEKLVKPRVFKIIEKLQLQLEIAA